MIFSYNWLQEYIKEELPKPKKLVELLTMYSFEIEDVKKIGNDFILDIDVLPNRASDCFSYHGIAREIAAITNLTFKIPDLKFKEKDNLKTEDFLNIKVEKKEFCSRYALKMIDDIKVGSSEKWIQERLKKCGLNSINNIVDIVNYVMLETGQPLHAFDFDKIKGSNVKDLIIRKAKKTESIIGLDDKKYNLNKDVLVISDKENVLAVAGIKGGKRAEIDKKTKRIVLEAANFNSTLIRKSSRELNLKTDASLRFEHGIDPNLIEYAINRVAYLIQKNIKVNVYKGIVDFYPKKALSRKINLELKYLDSLLGLNIPLVKTKNILKRLEFKYQEKKSNYLLVEIPSFRLDVSIQEDLIEEIGRIYGYENIPSVFPNVSLASFKQNKEIFWEDVVKNILKEVGFYEIYNYSFINKKKVKQFKFDEKGLIKLKNPMSVEQEYLRNSLIPNLLENVEENSKYFNSGLNKFTKEKEIKVFEIGKVFEKINSKIVERNVLSGLIYSPKGQKNLAFYELKEVCNYLFKNLGINNIEYNNIKTSSIWNIEKSAEIRIGNQVIGFLGEISQSIKIFDNSSIFIFDIDFDKLIKFCSEDREYKPISLFPVASRDLSILVSKETKLIDVLNKINIAGGSLLVDVDLFDVYEGKELPSNKKNFAFHLMYQAKDKTLTTEEIDNIHQKIVKFLEKNPKWNIRK